jgi:flagellar motor switch protein FliM
MGAGLSNHRVSGRNIPDIDNYYDSERKDRELTRTDLVLVNRLIDLILSDFNDSYKKVISTMAVRTNTETNLKMVSNIHSSESVLVVSLDIESKSLNGKIDLILTYPVVDIILKRTSKTFD